MLISVSKTALNAELAFLQRPEQIFKCLKNLEEKYRQRNRFGTHTVEMEKHTVNGPFEDMHIQKQAFTDAFSNFTRHVKLFRQGSHFNRVTGTQILYIMALPWLIKA